MKELEEFKKIVSNYGLDEKETYIDDKSMPWFSRNFLAELMKVTPPTITNNTNEIFDWGILDQEKNKKNFQLQLITILSIIIVLMC